jgi:hypothetical protein
MSKYLLYSNLSIMYTGHVLCDLLRQASDNRTQNKDKQQLSHIFPIRLYFQSNLFD